MSRDLRIGWLLLLRPCRQLIPRAPERGKEVVVDHLSQHLDGRALRADHLVADDARHHLVVANAPHRDPLVPFDQRLRELVQLLAVATLDVDLDDIQSGGAQRSVERLAERRRNAANLAEAGRVETAAMTEHAPDRLVLPRRHLLEHVELPCDELKTQRRAAQEPKRGAELALAYVRRRAVDLRRRELQPELGRLV